MMCFLKNPAFPKKKNSDRHFGRWTPNSVPKSGWNKDRGGGGEIHVEMGTIVSHPSNLPSVAMKASPGGLWSRKCPL